MTHTSDHADDFSLDRRELLAWGATFGSAFLAAQGLCSTADAAAAKPMPRKVAADSGQSYAMKKSINMWAFPYPQKMSLEECFRLAKDAGFDGIEVNYNLEGDISPEAKPEDLRRIGKMAWDMGLQISGLCSFLFWPYSLTSNDETRRKKGQQLARKMIAAAADLGTPNLLVVPGAVYIPWAPETTPVANDVCWERATAAIRSVLDEATAAGVSLNMENIFANGFLLSPEEMNRFVDQFDSPQVNVHFDTGNIMQYQFPEHWIDICGKRIRNIHLKEYSKRGGNEFNLESFRPLLDGTTDWPAVLTALQKIGYDGYLTFEYFHPFDHWPEALIYQTSDALDWMLGRRDSKAVPTS